MNAFESLQALFVADLRALHQIAKRGWLVLPITRAVKEEHLGRCCYLAEEFLSCADLCALKCQVGLDEQQWRRYKARVSAQ